MNTFHHCEYQGCTVTKTRIVVQERFRTSQQENEVTHNGNQDDCVLNLAQLHNAELVQIYQPLERYPGLPRAEWLVKAVAHRVELDAKAAEKKTQAAEKRAERGNKQKQPGSQSSARRGGQKRTRTQTRGDVVEEHGGAGETSTVRESGPV